MSGCEQATDRILDRLTGNLSEAERAELDRHLAECAECRTELTRMESMWTALAGVDVPPAHASGDRVVRPLPGVRRGRQAGLIAAALVVGLLGGYGAGVTRAPEPVPPPVAGPFPRGGAYLALLRQAGPSLGPGVPPEPVLIEEYGLWAEKLVANEQLIAAERLNDFDVVFLGPEGAFDELATEVAPHISGYFLIRALNFEDAKLTMTEIPHLKYGGWVELRETIP